MIVGYVALVDPVGNLILVPVLDVAPETGTIGENSRTTALLAALV